ncbi:MAG: (Fe-S)-binding protein [Gammaproteobacteria bacterium]|jgi:Fe-S oxidoreductase
MNAQALTGTAPGAAAAAAPRGASLERGLHVFLEEIDAPMASFFSSCVRCGLCAHACLFYTETEDPRYTPIHKLEPLRRMWRQEYTFWGKLAKRVGLAKPVTDDELTAWSELVYDSCTLCGRCSRVCPVGNDIVYMVRRMREGMAAAGHAPAGLIRATRNAILNGSPMGVKLATLEAQLRHVEKETGLKIPLDQGGAEYLAIFSSMEIVNYPEYIAALARIFEQAGVSWTISSEAFEATNAGIQIGQSDLAAEILSRIVKAAEKLKVKSVIGPECGHAYLALRWEGPNLLKRTYPFQVKHILELLDELRAAGKLPIQDTEGSRLTFHDPCQLVRQGGVVHEPRRLLQLVASDIVEMNEAGLMNWCCGGGGGVSAIERAESLRLKAFRRKKAQLDELGVEMLVTACANCRVVIEEGMDAYNMELPMVSLTELLAKHLVEAPRAGGTSA